MSARVNVLLSTYNGSTFLQEQLDSILSQSYEKIMLHIRDDGSTDDTPAVLYQYAGKHANIKVTLGENVGVLQSFFTLLADADESCEYYAFSDQDDVWLPEKLKIAVSELGKRGQEIPLMYCSAVEYVDESLCHIGFSKTPKRIGFGNALVQNIAVGCTIVINRTARDKVLEFKPKGNFVHDWWLYLFVSAFGEIIFDPRPCIKYRQHNRNTIGGSPLVIHHLGRRLARFLRHQKKAFKPTEQAQEFMGYYGKVLNSNSRRLLTSFLASKRSLWHRLIYCMRLGVWRQTIIDNILLRILIVLDIY